MHCDVDVVVGLSLVAFLGPDLEVPELLRLHHLKKILTTTGCDKAGGVGTKHETQNTKPAAKQTLQKRTLEIVRPKKMFDA